MSTKQKANSPSYVTILPPPFYKGGKEIVPLCISKGQPPTVLDSALTKVYHIQQASTIEQATSLSKTFDFKEELVYNRNKEGRCR